MKNVCNSTNVTTIQGTLALEDALSKGLPIGTEVAALHKSLEGIDKESLLDLALTSLSEEILNYGSSTLMQLNLKASQIILLDLWMLSLHFYCSCYCLFVAFVDFC